MTKREAVLEALAHRPIEPVPYYMDFTQQEGDRVAAYLGDPDFRRKLGNYLSCAYYSGDALPVPAQVGQDALPPGVAPLRRLLQPADGLLGAALHPAAVEAAHRQVGHGRGIARLGRLFVPVHRVGRVFLEAVAQLKGQAQAAHGGGIVHLSGAPEERMAESAFQSAIRQFSTVIGATELRRSGLSAGSC